MSSGTLARAPALPDSVVPAEVERALVGGDISRLNPEHRLAYYQARCRAAGLDPITRPFEYLQLNGKTVLYATKSCTDGLSGLHGLSHRIISRDTVGDVHTVVVEVSGSSGRSTQDIGAVVIGSLRGEALANALMKAVTKGKRRAVLSFCGLGDVIDETELDTVRNVERCDGDGNPIGHHARNHDNASGHGSGAYADPATVKAFSKWVSDFVDDVNAKWADQHTPEAGEFDPAVKDLLSTWQVSGHLLKFARANTLVVAPEEPRGAQREKFAALAWQRHKLAMEEEVVRYGRGKWREAIAKLKAAGAPAPEDDSQEPARDAADASQSRGDEDDLSYLDDDFPAAGSREPGEEG